MAAQTSAARAADPPAAEDPRYKDALAEALSEYEAGRYEEARALFRQAHGIQPNARTLRGIGMAAFELRDYVDALRSLRGALASTVRPLTPEQRKSVEALIERTKAFVAVYQPDVEPGATLRVNGKPAQLEPDGVLILAFGTHTVEATCEGCVPETRTVEVRGGESGALSLRNARLPVLAAASPSPTTTDRGPRVSRTTWLISAGAAAVVAGGFGVLWINRAQELDKCRDVEAGFACRNESTLSGQRGLAAAGTGVFAAAAITFGVLGLLTEPSADTGVAGHPAASTLACVPSPGGIGCAFTF